MCNTFVGRITHFPYRQTFYFYFQNAVQQAKKHKCNFCLGFVCLCLFYFIFKTAFMSITLNKNINNKTKGCAVVLWLLSLQLYAIL